jgi:pimeloyl-ACP methyl ester carboxylesterase
MPALHTHGARVSYTRTGIGEPVLLIQGVGSIGKAWTPQVEALRHRFSVITFDNRGIGASTITEGRLTIESMADDALAILDAEGIDRCHVVGHSMGGLIAMQLALLSPRRVRSLALLCTFPDGKSGSRLTRDTLFTGIRTRLGTRTMRRNAFLSLVVSKAGMRSRSLRTLAAEMTELFGRDLADQPSIIMKQLRAMARFDPTWRLRCLASIRTLVVSGEEDRIALPAYGRKLAAAIPGALYVQLEKAGHAVPIESPASISRLLGEHMREAAHDLAS